MPKENPMRYAKSLIHGVLVALLFMPTIKHQLEAATAAFDHKKTVLPDALFTRPDLSSCQDDSWLAFLNDRNVDKLYLQVNRHFLLGVCRFYKHSSRRDESQLAPAIDALQKAQLGGLNSAQQNLALLFEGLLETRLAASYLQSIDGDDTLDRKARFCAYRAMASVAFGDINWSAMSLDYERANGKPTLDSLVEEMAAAYENGPLSSAWDPVCAINRPLEGEAFVASIQAALKPIEEKYLGPTGPIGGIFSRKIEKTRGVLTTAEEQIKTLTADSLKVNQIFDSYRLNFAPVKSEISELVGRYKEAVVTAYRIIDEYNQWQDGLWWEETKTGGQVRKVDMKKPFQDAIEKFKNTVAPLTMPSSPGAQDTALEQSQQAVQTILAAFQDPDQDRTAIQGICSVYFCQIKSPVFWNRIQKGCQKDRTISALCDQGKELELAAVCRNAGFTSIPTGLPRPEETEACMSQYMSQSPG